MKSANGALETEAPFDSGIKEEVGAVELSVVVGAALVPVLIGLSEVETLAGYGADGMIKVVDAKEGVALDSEEEVSTGEPSVLLEVVPVELAIVRRLVRVTVCATVTVEVPEGPKVV